MGRLVERQQPDPQARSDQVLHELETVDPVGDRGREPRHRGERVHDLLVGGVAGVHDPPRLPVAAEQPGGVLSPGRHRAGYAEPPVGRPQGRLLHRALGGCRSEVVVVGQDEVDLVAAEQAVGLDRFVLVDLEPHLGVLCREVVHQGQEGTPDGGREPGDPHGARGVRRGIEVVPGGVDGREDRDGVVRQPLARWGEAHPATDGFEQRGPDLASQCSDLLRHRGRGDVELLRDLAHRADLRKTQQHLQSAQIHEMIVHQQ